MARHHIVCLISVPAGRFTFAQSRASWGRLMSPKESPASTPINLYKWHKFEHSHPQLLVMSFINYTIENIATFNIHLTTYMEVVAK